MKISFSYIAATFFPTHWFLLSHFQFFFLPNRFDVFMRRKRHQNFIWMIGFDRCNLNFRANLSPIHHHHCEPNSTTLLSPSPVRNGHTSVSTKLGILRIFFCEISKINISFNFFPVVSPKCGLKLNKWFQEFNWDKKPSF